MKIFMITADYRSSPITIPYAVRANSKKEAREYFKNKFPWLMIFYVGDPDDIKWFW